MNPSGQTLPFFNRCALLLCVAATLGGCTTHHSAQTAREWLHKTEFVDHHRLSRQQAWTLPPGATVYIAFPDSHHPDAVDLQVQQILAQQLGRYFPLLERGLRPRAPAVAMARARARGAPFMVYPRLLNLSDRANTLGELNDSHAPGEEVGRDRLQVQLLIFDCVSRQLLDAAVVSSRSGWLGWGRRKPADMLAPAFEKFARSLSAAPANPFPSYQL